MKLAQRLSEGTKASIKNAFLFILGVVATIIITKSSDRVFPNDPTIVKQLTDTIKILHDYKIPQLLNDDTTRLELEKRLYNLELLNSYDKQIRDRLGQIEKLDGSFPNLILTGSEKRGRHAGYTSGGSSAYFASICPDINDKFLDLKLDFLNPDITKDIAYLKVTVYQFATKASKEARTLILEERYVVRHSSNVIRLINDFPAGKYEVVYGFIFKSELANKYPTFNSRTCIVEKYIG